MNYCRLTPSAILVSVMLATLTACATATPYQAADKGKGYSNEQLETDRYRVSFAGNSLTARETVENYLLYRAAEITLENGFDYFIMVERDTETKTTYRTTYNDFGRFSRFNSFSRFHSFHRFGFVGRGFNGFGFKRFEQATSRPISSYIAYANIVVYHGEEPDNPDAYNAQDIQTRLSPTIVLNEDIR